MIEILKITSTYNPYWFKMETTEGLMLIHLDDAVFPHDTLKMIAAKPAEKENGPFDVVIDDGGHTMHQQLTTFKTLA